MPYEDRVSFKQMLLEQDLKKNSEKVYSESFGLFLFALSNITYALTAFQIKYLNILLPEVYDGYLLSMWRSVAMMFISYTLMKHKRIEIRKMKNINHKFWFAIRTAGQFFAYISWVFSLLYIRVGAAQSIASMNPAVVVILSTFILKEKFHIRYVFGIFICFLGTLMIISNDRKAKVAVIEDSSNEDFKETSHQNEVEAFYNLLLGCFWASGNLIFTAMLSVSSKILIEEKIEFENQIFYQGLTNSILSICPFLFISAPPFSFAFIIGSFINGITLIIGHLLLNESLKGVDLNKTTPLAFLGVLTVFLLGVTLLGEPIYFTDIIGSLIIVGYNVFNSLHPIK